MKSLVIIKLGGSVITDKNTPKPKFRTAVVKRICKEINDAKNKLDFDLILVHGAGSFGHPLAKKYRLNAGYISKKSSKGISLTKQSVLKLNYLVLEEMRKVDLNACLIETSAVATTANGKIKTFNLMTINSLLEKGLTPVLSGDVVFDSKKGISILSGDQIVVYLGRELNANKIIFASDVNGIYDVDPKKTKSAKLITEVNGKNYKQIINRMKTKNSMDVTGEMKGKILAIKSNLKKTPAFIINGLTIGNLQNALFDRMNGTRILF